MLPSTGGSALQEDLPLEPTGRFQFGVELAALGLDPELVDLLLADGPLCFLDFEATGLEPSEDELIEAGAVLVRPGSPTAEVFNSVIHTRRELSPFITRLTGIKQQEVDEAPPLEEIAPALDAFIGEVPVVAHNAAFERAWLRLAVDGRFARHCFLDTVELLGLVYPDSPNMKLDTFCRRKLGREERHRALDDALDTLRVVVNILSESRAGSPAAANALAAMRSYNRASPWLARLAGAPGAATVASQARPTAAPVVEVPAVPLEREAIAARLKDVETGAQVVGGFELRPGQSELMSRVYDAFASVKGKSVVLCEAGTGIGKTLAYLSVAIPFARKTGEQVIVSTSSKVLQTQLLEKDIPAAAQLLGYPDLRYTVMKGRANYICRSRLDRFLERRASDPELISGPGSFACALICAFANSSGHGELDRIPNVLSQLNPELERFKREVASGDSLECSRQTCEMLHAECVFRAARHRLEGAEIAVVNHDLLLRWPPDYPPLRHLIIDEIHELVDKADAAYARSADAVEIAHRIQTVLGTRGDHEPVADEEARALAREAAAKVVAMGEAALAVSAALGNDKEFQFGRDDLVIPPDGPGPTWKEVIDASGDLADDLARLARRLAGLAESDDSPWAGAAEALIDASAILEAALPYPKSDEFVFRLRGLSRQDAASWRLVATPVSPAADFQMHVLDQAETVFGTSATLSVGGDVTGAVRELEFESRAAGRFLVAPPVPSPFDYEKNLRVVFISEPTRPAELVEKMARATATVASRLGGRTLSLFTSRDRMMRVADLLDPVLAKQGISIISPAGGGADPHELVRNFRDSDRAVLLGSRALWQGIDIPGEACQAVVIEKLPFDVPGDPLMEKRAQLVESEGGNAFGDYTLPRMLLRLSQMMGRLIRTPTDKGLIVIVEPRSDKRYFKSILEIVPGGAPYSLVPLRDLEAIVDDFFTLHDC